MKRLKGFDIGMSASGRWRIWAVLVVASEEHREMASRTIVGLGFGLSLHFVLAF